MLLNLGVQVLTVRYLSRVDFGAFANALSIVSLASTLCVVGLNKAVSRFVPLHHERSEWGGLFGTISLAVGLVCALGLVLVSGVYLLPNSLNDFASSPQAVTLLLILIFLAPLDAMDSLLRSLYSVFSRAWAIFVRRYLLGPGLKLTAVVLVTLFSGDAVALAIAYVIAGVLGLVVGLSLLFKILKDEGLLEHFRWREMELKPRELLGFSLPMMGSEMVLVLRGTGIVILLGYFHDALEVAAFSAVFPLARMIRGALQSFTLMFMPAVTRLQVRGEMDQLAEMYWRSTAWVAVLSFPSFILCFAVARPVTTLIFGDRYADSASILAVLSVGYFVQSCVGLAPRTLKAMGLVRLIMKIDAAAIVLALALDFLLIPRFGAIGGAFAATITLCLHMILNQLGLVLAGGISMIHGPYLRLLALFVAATTTMYVVQEQWSLSVYVAVPVAAALVLLVVYLSRDLLQVPETFPEIVKVPVVGRALLRVLATPGKGADSQ